MSIQDGGFLNSLSRGFCGSYKDCICQPFGLKCVDVFYSNTSVYFRFPSVTYPFNFIYFELHLGFEVAIGRLSAVFELFYIKETMRYDIFGPEKSSSLIYLTSFC